MDIVKADLNAFEKAIQTLKLYRRAEIESEKGDSLIEELYVDPLPNNHVYQTMLKPNTTFLIGRKGTGKSTVFQRAQKGLLRDKYVLSTYIDIKTVYETAQVDPERLARLAASNNALSRAEVQSLLLMLEFLKAVIAGIREDMKKQLDSAWRKRFIQAFKGTYSDVFSALDDFLADLGKSNFVNVEGIRTPDLSLDDSWGSSSEAGGSASVTLGANPSVTLGLNEKSTSTEDTKTSTRYTSVLLRIINIKELILRLREILEPLGVKHLYVFVDDFSELPEPAMKAVVDALLSPLNNWSNELVKFKVAAYPGRIYYGDIDKSKIDELSLDAYSLYGGTSVAEMESKSVDFTRRLIESRLQYFGTSIDRFIENLQPQYVESVWRTLFFASMGNPRILGNLLISIYETQLIYGRPLGLRAIRDAAQRYYVEKIEWYFGESKFLQEAFEERSSIYSLKELLESIVSRARSLRQYEGSKMFKHAAESSGRRGVAPTSHFYVPQKFDPILVTLELNFFLTKYYVQSDRKAQRVSVYALNYGLCEKHGIQFGRPDDTRESRLYFVERVFDYSGTLEGWIASNQEIKCDKCGTIFEDADLPALRRYKMGCPDCGKGVCHVINTSRKYEELLRDVADNSLLPDTELGILHTLTSENRPMLAGEIAEELDVSHQLIGVRGKRLAENDLVNRLIVKGRRRFSVTDKAKEIYFSDPNAGSLQIDDE